MMIRDEVITTSSFLEAIFGGRKRFHLTNNSRKHVKDLKFFENVDWRRSYNCFLEAISGGRKHFHLTENSRKQV